MVHMGCVVWMVVVWLQRRLGRRLLMRVLLLMLGMGMLVTRLLLLLLGVMAIGQCVGAIGDDAGVIVIMALLDMS